MTKKKKKQKQAGSCDFSTPKPKCAKIFLAPHSASNSTLDRPQSWQTERNAETKKFKKRVDLLHAEKNVTRLQQNLSFFLFQDVKAARATVLQNIARWIALSRDQEKEKSETSRKL